MMMRAGDYRIYATEGTTMYVVADMLAMGMEWPPTLVSKPDNKIYRFKCNELMEDWMIGNYSGHALYEEDTGR